MHLRHLQLNGGRVEKADTLQLLLPPVVEGYADAQIDDYGHGRRRSRYPWHPGTSLSLRARFSHAQDDLQGTAGFGFWNAPFGDPTTRVPALPQAAWFFFASRPTDLPLAADGPGRGWFASTIDAGGRDAFLLVPLAPAVLLLNQSSALRSCIWPCVQRRMKISFAPIGLPMDRWAQYRLIWLPGGCSFSIEDQVILQTSFSPRGPLGFVCWIDNQYLLVTARGRIKWGVLSTTISQRLELADIRLTRV